MKNNWAVIGNPARRINHCDAELEGNDGDIDGTDLVRDLGSPITLGAGPIIIGPALLASGLLI